MHFKNILLLCVFGYTRTVITFYDRITLIYTHTLQFLPISSFNILITQALLKLSYKHSCIKSYAFSRIKRYFFPQNEAQERKSVNQFFKYPGQDYCPLKG